VDLLGGRVNDPMQLWDDLEFLHEPAREGGRDDLGSRQVLGLHELPEAWPVQLAGRVGYPEALAVELHARLLPGLTPSPRWFAWTREAQGHCEGAAGCQDRAK